jgi:hypothetical protein
MNGMEWLNEVDGGMKKVAVMERQRKATGNLIQKNQ